MKFENFWAGVNIENATMATLPPINGVDDQLQKELLTVVENRVNYETDYLHEMLPRCLDNIKRRRYETMHSQKEVS